MEQMKQRKNQHLEHAINFHKESNKEWESVALPITSFPEINKSEISIATNVMGFTWNVPFFINAMTGGSTRARELNRKLAILARECDLALAMGSYSVALRLPEARASFAVIREEAPKICLGVNLGADKDWKMAELAIFESKADFLQVHVNPLQELVMPEGERNFRGWLANIEEIVAKSPIPVMVKQVGFGMSQSDIKTLLQIGVKTIDLGGMGGTNFAQIENARRENKMEEVESIGISTVQSLLHAKPFQGRAEFIATGGIKNPLHIAKAIAMGARAVGIAGQFLYMLEKEGLERTIAVVQQWKDDLRSYYLICGAEKTEDLYNAPIS